MRSLSKGSARLDVDCLQAHAKEGIVAAHYGDPLVYEFSLRFHPGQSGGPVIHAEKCAALSLIQHYRNLKTVAGAQIDGPARGHALAVIGKKLTEFGAKVV